MPALELRIPTPVVGRVHTLDELKGVAILLILFYHAGGVLVWNNYLHGDVGVDIFLILSGLGLALNSRTESFWDFAKRRVLRLMPAYWLILSVYIAANTHFLQHKYSASNIVTHALGIHGLFGDQIGLSINDSFWFITAILFLYAAFWFISPQLERLDRAVFWMGIVSASVALGLFFAGQSGLMGHAGFRVPSFFLGMMVGHILRKGHLTLHLTTWSGIGLFCLAYIPYTRGVTFYSAFVGIAIIALYAYGVRPHLGDSNSSVKTLDFLGRHSLEIFLIHQPLIREYNYYFHGRWLSEPSPSAWSLSVGMLIGIVATLIASVELHRLQRFFFKP
ncbi:hypothetical protein DB347_14845 [Opitutaceae bacterium EW11]|nr:hypothetical protein DB347_14845 [Opitutaceae bacterium EW11]